MKRSKEVKKWLEQVKGFLQRCRDTEWDDHDDYIMRVILSNRPKIPEETNKDAYQELFGLLESIEKPHTNSEMNDIINCVLKWWGK